MKLLAVFLLVSSVVVQASGNPHICSIQTSITCPSGWTPINCRCFLYVSNDMTWAKAEKNCQSMGANLASVHNADEYLQVQNLITAAGHESNLAWIGGSDAQEDNHWFWIDGTPFLYTNWCAGEPNNYREKQDCLQMNHKDHKCWDDVQCHLQRPSVCAKKATFIY